MERFHGLFRGILLEEPDDDIEDNDRTDHPTLDPRLNPETDRHGQNQHLQQRIGSDIGILDAFHATKWRVGRLTSIIAFAT